MLFVLLLLVLVCLCSSEASLDPLRPDSSRGLGALSDQDHHRNLFRRKSISASQIFGSRSINNLSNSDSYVVASLVALSPSAKAASRLLLILCTLMYGTSYVSTILIQNQIDPVTLTTLRFGLSAIAFIPFLYYSRSEKKVSKTFVLNGMELGLWLIMGFLSQGIALKKSSAAKASFICALGSIMPPLFDVIWKEEVVDQVLLKKRLDANKEEKRSIVQKLLHWPFTSPILGCIGAGILELAGLEPPEWGDLLLFVGPLTFSMCFWRSEKFISRHPGQSVMLTAIMLSTAFVVSFLYALFTGVVPCTSRAINELVAVISQKQILANLVYISFGVTALVSYLEQRALVFLSASEITVIYSLEPLFASLSAAFFLDEHIGSATIVSAILIMFACILDALR